MSLELKGTMVLQGKEIFAGMNFELVPGNYFAEVMIWEAGSVLEHVESMYSMQQAAAAAAVAAVVAAAEDIAVVAVAFPLPIGLHRLVDL